MTKPIACDLHDYLEIACLYQYRVKLELKDNRVLEGKAIDIVTTNGQEYLVVENADQHKIDLNHLLKLKVLTPNAKFGEVRF